MGGLQRRRLKPEADGAAATLYIANLQPHAVPSLPQKIPSREWKSGTLAWGFAWQTWLIKSSPSLPLCGKMSPSGQHVPVQPVGPAACRSGSFANTHATRTYVPCCCGPHSRMLPCGHVMHHGSGKDTTQATCSDLRGQAGCSESELGLVPLENICWRRQLVIPEVGNSWNYPGLHQVARKDSGKMLRRRLQRKGTCPSHSILPPSSVSKELTKSDALSLSQFCSSIASDSAVCGPGSYGPRSWHRPQFEHGQAAACKLECAPKHTRLLGVMCCWEYVGTG